MQSGRDASTHPCLFLCGCYSAPFLGRFFQSAPPRRSACRYHINGRIAARVPSGNRSDGEYGPHPGRYQLANNRMRPNAAPHPQTNSAGDEVRVPKECWLARNEPCPAKAEPPRKQRIKTFHKLKLCIKCACVSVILPRHESSTDLAPSVPCFRECGCCLNRNSDSTRCCRQWNCSGQNHFHHPSVFIRYAN